MRTLAQKNYLSYLSLIAATIFLQVPALALATDSDLLKAETATEAPLSTTSLSPTSAPETKTLVGGVKKHQALKDTENGSTSSVPLQAEASDSNPLRTQALKKLAANLELTSEEYRSLEAGCAGYESYRPFFQPIARVSIVYTGSPAEKAGIKKGDKIIDRSDDSEAKKDPTMPLEQVSIGVAGTPVEITVLRHGHEVNLTLVRMNIEDIKETTYRKQWEDLIKDLNYPTDGSYIGPDLKTLKPIVRASDNL